MLPKLILHNHCRSSCSWRVRSVLALKNIKYEYRSVDIFTGVNNQPEYRKLNPIGQIPALEIISSNQRKLIISQSMPIIEYLEQIKPRPSVHPFRDPFQRAQVSMLVDVICSGLQPLQNIGVAREVDRMFGSGSGSDWCRFWVNRKFVILEKMITESSGRFTVGDQLSLADVCLVPQVFNAIQRFELRIEDDFPKLNYFYRKLLEEVEAIRETRPEVQPDRDF